MQGPGAPSDEATAAPPGLKRHGASAALAVLVGGLLALQSRTNGEMGHVLGDGVLAAVINFVVVLLLLLGAALVRRPTREALVARLPLALRTRQLRWWHLLGGLAGALFVTAQSNAVPVLGVALFTVLTVAATSGFSLGVDRWGLGPAGVQHVTPARLAVAVGTTLAVALAVSGRSTSGQLVWWAAVLALVAGAGTAFQQAFNGRIAQRTDDGVVAGVVNCVVGLAALLLALLLSHLRSGAPLAVPPAPWSEPVLWLGGFVGAVYLVTAALLVRPLGVLVFSLLSIAGQLVGALLLDVVAPAPGTSITWQLVTGVVVALAVVAWAALPGRR